MSDPMRGITCPDMRRVAREAIKAGWVYLGMSGTTHIRIQWPPTGDVLQFGTTPGLASWKTTAKDIKRVSGVETHRKSSRKPSRKNFTAPDDEVEAARRKHLEHNGERLDQEAERREQAKRAAASLRRERDITDLMRPGR